jgi:hypothetical protein
LESTDPNRGVPFEDPLSRAAAPVSPPAQPPLFALARAPESSRPVLAPYGLSAPALTSSDLRGLRIPIAGTEGVNHPCHPLLPLASRSECDPCAVAASVCVHARRWRRGVHRRARRCRHHRDDLSIAKRRGHRDGCRSLLAESPISRAPRGGPKARHGRRSVIARSWAKRCRRSSDVAIAASSRSAVFAHLRCRRLARRAASAARAARRPQSGLDATVASRSLVETTREHRSARHRPMSPSAEARPSRGRARAAALHGVQTHPTSARSVSGHHRRPIGRAYPT